MTIIIKQDNEKIMRRYIGRTKFAGCQCRNDCTCREDFKRIEYDYFEIHRVINDRKSKTTSHATRGEAEKRWEFLNKLNNNNN